VSSFATFTGDSTLLGMCIHYAGITFGIIGSKNYSGIIGCFSEIIILNSLYFLTASLLNSKEI